jgi:hypothetical protein
MRSRRFTLLTMTNYREDKNTMTSTETYADLESIFHAGTEAVTRTELDEKELTEVLDRLDSVSSVVETHFTAETKPDMHNYWQFIRAWFKNKERVSTELDTRYDSIIRAITAGIFDRSLDGFLFESMDEDPDIDFLDACLEDAVMLSCDCDEEPELAFLCLPTRLQVALLKQQEPIDGLDMPEDIDYLRRRFERFEAVLKDKVFTIDKDHLFYA